MEGTPARLGISVAHLGRLGQDWMADGAGWIGNRPFLRCLHATPFRRVRGDASCYMNPCASV